MLYSDDEDDIVNPDEENNNESEQLLEQAKQEGTQKKANQSDDYLKKKISEKVTKKAAEKMGTEAIKQQMATQVISALAPLLPYIAIAVGIILAIIMIIGIIAFLAYMPGLMSDKLKTWGNNISESFKSIYMQDTVSSIDDSEIVELANYINNMNYDLLGFGFVKPKTTYDIKTAEDLEKEGYIRVTKNSKVDDKDITLVYYEQDADSNGKGDGFDTRYKDTFFDKDGVLYYGGTGNKLSNDDKKTGEYTKYGIKYDQNNQIIDLKNVDTSLLRTYAISNKSIYVLRNNEAGYWSTLFNGIHDFFSNENYGAWANGLVRIYKSNDNLATEEYISTIWNLDTWFESVEFTANNKLKLKNGAFNKSIDFETDGWIGRYGLSQDLLISLHLATLSPELVETIVQSYDTEVQVYLDEVHDAKAKVVMIDTNSDVINTDSTGLTMEDFTGRFSNIGLEIDDNLLDMDAWHISKDEAKKFYYYTDIDSPKNCIYSYKGPMPDHVVITDIGNKGLLCAFDDPNVSEEDYVINNKNLIAPYKIAEDIEKAIDDNLEALESYGFDKKSFEENVALKDNDRKCSTKYQLKDEYQTTYSPKENYNFSGSCSYNDSNGYEHSGKSGDPHICINENGIGLMDKDIFTDDAFNKLGNLQNDWGIAAGSECIYETSYISKDTESIGFVDKDFSDKDTYCSCEFCSTFYNKYIIAQRLASWDLDRPDFDAMLENEDLACATDSETFAVDLYSWTKTEFHDGIEQDIEYRLSFYSEGTYKTHFWTENEYDKVYLVLTRSWTEKENKNIIETMKEVDTCAKVIKEIKNKYEDPYKKDESKALNEVLDVKLCSKCRAYVKNIVKSLKTINDNEFDAFVPYIARVIDSWFRDTYFIIPTENILTRDEDNRLVSKDAAIQDAFEEHGYQFNDLIGTDIKVIQNDNEFLDITGELWTEYILDPTGKYAKFIVDTTGNVFERKADLDTYLGKLKENEEYLLSEDDEKSLRSYIQEEYKYKSNSGEQVIAYGRWKASENNEHANELLKKYNINLIKIPITKKVDSIKSGTSNQDIAWSAYTKFSSDAAVWENISITDDQPYALRNVRDNYFGFDDSGKAYEYKDGSLAFRVGFQGVFNLSQTQDAQRGMTNSKIKYLFKNKKYYTYDGSIQKAFAISNDWNECVNLMDFTDALVQNPGNLAKSVARTILRPKTFSIWSIESTVNTIKTETNILQETTLESYIDAVYYQDNALIDKIQSEMMDESFKFARDLSNPPDGIADIASTELRNKKSYKGLTIDESTVFTKDPRNPALISKLDINSESLTAFSILENTHTADADYAYRDLKELFCELDYFDKEDLVEPAKNILEWPLPDSGSYGWPVRTLDKMNEFGSLIHSTKMYDELNDIYLIKDTSAEDVVSGYKNIVDSLDPIISETTDNNQKIENLKFQLESVNLLIEKLNREIEANELDESILSEYEEMLSTYKNKKLDITNVLKELPVPEPEKVEESNNSEENIDAIFESPTDNELISSRNISSAKVQYEEISKPNLHCESITTINGITYRNYKQNFWEWGAIPYSQGTMTSSACGATSCAVVLSGFGSDLTPKDTAEWLKNHCGGAETNVDSLLKCLANYGVQATADYSSSHTKILEKIRAAWTAGKPVIANVGVGEMTSYGHYIVILGEYDGKVVISEVGGSNRSYIENGYLYKYGNLEAMDKSNYIKGVIIPDVVPTGYSLETGETPVFEGYEKYQPIVAPATAKILEIGTITVNNETSETIMDTIYASENGSNEENSTSSDTTESDESSEGETNNNDSKKKTMVTQAEYDSINAATLEKQADSENPFGNTYKTGYIKLEVIGAETMEKFKALNKKSSETGITTEIYEGLNSYYQEYYKNGESICDSYVIYIEGIDLTGELESGVAYESIDDLIIGKIFNENSGDENASLEQSLLDGGAVITSDDTIREEIGNSATSSLEKNIILNDEILYNQIASLGTSLVGNAPKYTDTKKPSPPRTYHFGNYSVPTEPEETNTPTASGGTTEFVPKEPEFYDWRKHIKYNDGKKYSDEYGKKIVLNINGEEKEYRINYYTREEIPDYYADTAKDNIEKQENTKDKLSSIIKINNEIYLKAGTLIGLTGDANMKIVLKNKEEAVVENVEDYLEIDDLETTSKVSVQTESFSVIGTVYSKSEWVDLAYNYTSTNKGDGTFYNKSNLEEMYEICDEYGVNPEIAFVRAIHESSLSDPLNNYWKVDTPNWASTKPFKTWQAALKRFCELYTEYQDPSNPNYDAIMQRYEERAYCSEFGGCDPYGYGTPDTLQGIQSIYSWIGDDHLGNDSGAGGMYYLYPWGWAGDGMYTGENKIIFDSKEDFEQKCGSIHGTAGGVTSSTPTSIWEQSAYTGWQVKKMVDEAKSIFGEKAGTYGG